jgi:outer membrane immunogenic protein
MKRVVLALALSSTAGSTAFAADLPPSAPAPRAPAVYTPAPIPNYNWTGLYIGGNLGASWQQGNFGDQFDNSFSANNRFTGTGGGQVGINYQFPNDVVVGAEAMFDWRFNNGNTSDTVPLLIRPGGLSGGTASLTVNNQWLTTATGKLGYAFDQALVYAKAGGAWVGSNNPTININGQGTTISTSNSNWGWTVGGGFEYAFWGTWSARVEYDYVGLTNQILTLTNGGGGLPAGEQFTGSGRNVQLITAGINYKFGGW